MKFDKENYFFKRRKDSSIETYSLSELKESIDWAIKTAETNKRNPSTVPVFIVVDGKKHVFSDFSVGFGNLGMVCETAVSDYDEICFVAPDSRPEEGEYWRSRGIGGSDINPDCSGFVVSKKAGERLRRMVNLVLEKDETESWLDFREKEPNWIQYKFSGHEFDLEKLEEMASEKGNVVTLEILKQCKVTK